MFRKLILLITLAVAPAVAQNTTYGFGDLGGVSTYQPTPTNWAPTLTLANLTNNNTAECATNCAPSIMGSTTGTSISNFPGEQELRYTASVTRSGGSITVTPGLNQGAATAVGTYDGVYNFATTDKMIIESCGVLNGTYAIGSVTHGTSSTPGGNLKGTLSGTTLTNTNCTVRRNNATEADTYLFPSNIATTQDGVYLNDYLYGPGNGNSVPIFFHLEPWFHCPTTGGCNYVAKNGTSPYTGSHIRIGYKSIDPAVIHAQRLEMESLVSPSVQLGMDVDWGGGPYNGDSQTKKDEKSVMALWANELAGQTHTLFFGTQDNSGFNAPCSTITPVCVEKVILNTFLYMHTPNGTNYTSPIDGTTQVGTGMFANTAYFHDPTSGRPVFATFINGTTFGNCASGCATWNGGGTPGSCNSNSNCWQVIDQEMASYMASWATSETPLIFYRNTFTDNTSTLNGGAYIWQNVSTDMTNESFPDSTLLAGKTSSKKLIDGAIGRVDHGEDSFADDAKGVGDRCGQTFEDWMQRGWKLNDFGPGVGKFPLAKQIITYSDCEEGTCLEPGINSCYGISANIASGIVTWNLSTTNSTYAPIPTVTTNNCYGASTGCNDTLDHVALLAVKQGGAIGGLDTQVLATTPLSAGGFSSGTFNMSGFTLDSGTYTIIVRLVPKAFIHTSMSGNLSYTR